MTINSKSENDQMNHLRIVLQVLKDKQFFTKFIKCEFWLRLVTFLRHIVSREGGRGRSEKDACNQNLSKTFESYGNPKIFVFVLVL